MQYRQTIIQGIFTTYLESPILSQKRPLVFLHGWWQSAESFSTIYSILDTQKIAYIGVDLPWFWRTETPSIDWGIEEYAEWVAEFIRKMSLDSIILIGHSFWGRIALILGSQDHMIEKIILIGSAGILPRQNIIRSFIVTGGKYFFLLPGLRTLGKYIKKRISSRDYNNAGALQDIFLRVIRTDLISYMRHSKYPTLLVWGDQDTETPLSDGERMHACISGSQMVIIPSGTHFVFQEFPQEVWTPIRVFIDS